MSKIKIERINSQIIKELSQIISSEVKSDIIKNITITAVDVTPDLGLAKIYYTFMSDHEKDIIQKELTNASKFLRTQLANKIDIRHTPELKFIFDESINYGANIEKILSEIKK